MTIGFLGISLDETSLNDTKAAMKVWGETIARERNLSVQVTVRMFESPAEIRRDLAAGEVDMLALDTKSYLESLGNAPLDPTAVMFKSGSVREEYVLAVHRESGIKSLAGLRRKAIEVQTGGSGNYLAKEWLEGLLQSDHLPDAASFFLSVKEATKVSRATLPVFFRQADACVVNREALRTLVELNPQVGSQLEVLATSPGYLSALVAFRRSFHSSVREELTKAMMDLHREPRGQQILNIFRYERIVPFEPGYLDTARQLLASLERADSRSGARAPKPADGAPRRTPARPGGTGAAAPAP